MIDVATDTWIYFCGSDETETTTKCYWELYIDVILIAASISINNVMLEAAATSVTSEDQASSIHDYSSSLLLHGFVQFSLLYFSIMNSWYLYSHHYTSRFVGESSKIQSMLVACYVIGMLLSTIYCNDGGNSVNHQHDHDDDYMYMRHVQGFSISMIIQRVSIFVMVARVAIHIPQVSPLCAFLGFFIGDSILCYTLSAADTQAAPFLWGFVVIMELHVDFFLLVLNGNTTPTTTDRDREYYDYSYNGILQSQRRQHRLRSSLSYDLKLTMDRAWILILAPLGSLMVTLTTNLDCRNCNKLLICSSITLLVLLAFLYYDLQYTAYEQVTSRGSELCRALLLTVIKFLGWAIWTVGACLVVLIVRDGRHHRHSQQDGTGNAGDNDNDYEYDDEGGSYGYFGDESGSTIIGVHLLLGWSVGGSLILSLALKLFGQRRRPNNGLVQVLWVVACWIPFLVVCFMPSSRTSTAALSIYLVLVSSLNIVEAWINLSSAPIEEEERNGSRSESERQPQQRSNNNDDERQRLISSSSTTNDSVATYNYTSP